MAGLRCLAPSWSVAEPFTLYLLVLPLRCLLPWMSLRKRKGGPLPPFQLPQTPRGTSVSLVTMGTTMSCLWILGRLLLEASHITTFLLYSWDSPPSALSRLLHGAQVSTAFLQKVCSHLTSALWSPDPVYSCAPGPLTVGSVISRRNLGHAAPAEG